MGRETCEWWSAVCWRSIYKKIDGSVQRTTIFTGLDKVAKDPTQMKIVEGNSNITCKSDITKYDWAATADDKVWKTCAGYKCAINFGKV